MPHTCRCGDNWFFGETTNVRLRPHLTGPTKVCLDIIMLIIAVIIFRIYFLDAFDS